MGRYLNPDNTLYQMQINSPIVVDKTLLIHRLIKRMNTTGKYICMSRPRRFGKSTDANMLAAFFSKGCNSANMFKNLKISDCENYEDNLNKHNVIQLNIQQFIGVKKSIAQMEALMYKSLSMDAQLEYGVESPIPELPYLFYEIYKATDQGIIFIIDEWDCVFREFKDNKEFQKDYLNLLRTILKDQPYVSLAYMTGILPIKKNGTNSELNMFKEITMLNPSDFCDFMGFTDDEVKLLCETEGVDFECMKEWYDGYRLKEGFSVYSPNSVIEAIQSGEFSNYWTRTESYENLQEYIDFNLDGLRDSIIKLLSDEKISINAMSYKNDLSSFLMKDDILTLLVHLGYLGFDAQNEKVYIPNKEVRTAFVTSIQNSNGIRMQNLHLHCKFA